MKLDIRLTSMGLPLLLFSLLVSSVHGNPTQLQVQTVPKHFWVPQTLQELERHPLEESNPTQLQVETVPGHYWSPQTLPELERPPLEESNPTQLQVETVPEHFWPSQTLPELERLPYELPTIKCSGDRVNEMARGSEETCTHISNIEDYVNVVMSMTPLQGYYKTHSDFTHVFQQYDNDLGVAKDHAKLWRNGDSILSGIRQTFELTRNFEPEFNDKYRTNKERVEVIKANAGEEEMIIETRDKLEELKSKLIEAENALAVARRESSSTYGFLQGYVSTQKAEIRKNELALSRDFTLPKELKELIGFLADVRKNSDRIRTQALKTKQILYNFREYLKHDEVAFTRHGRVADETLTALEEKAIRNNEALAVNKRKQEELEGKIEEERQQVKALFKKIEHSREELLKIRRMLLDRISYNRKLKIAGIAVFPLKLIGAIIGTLIYVYASSEEKKTINLLEIEKTMNGNKVNETLKQIEFYTAELRFLQEQMANSPSNSDQQRDELTTFVTLDGDLKNVNGKVETPLVAIDKAIAGVVNIQVVFDDVTTQLTRMIASAKSAKTEAEKTNALLFILKQLSPLQCNWRNANFKVLKLDECTKNF